MEVVVFPRIAGVQWSDTVGSTLWGMAACVVVVLNIVLGPAKIAPVVLPAPAGGVVVAGVWSLSRRDTLLYDAPCHSSGSTHLELEGAVADTSVA